MKKFRFYFITILMILTVVLSGLFFSSSYTASSKAELQDITDGWEFYDNLLYEDIISAQARSLSHEIVQVPHLWNQKSEYGNKPFGFAVYRIQLNDLDPNGHYGILFGDVPLSCRVWINRDLLFEIGKVGRIKEDYDPFLQTHWEGFYPDASGSAEIVVEIANFDFSRSGFLNAPKIGAYEAVNNYVDRALLVQMFLFAGMLIMGLIFLAMYVRSSREKLNIYLASFSILVALRIIFSGDRLISLLIPGLSCFVSDRILFMIGYLLLPVAGLTVNTLGYSKKLRTISWLCYILVAAAVGLTVFGAIELYSDYYDIYKYFVILLACYTLYSLFQGIRHRKTSAVPTTIAYLLMIIGAVAELFIGNMPYIVGFATFGMIGVFLAIQIDNTHEIRLNKEKLESEILYDKLTGAYNRMFLEQRIGDVMDFADRFGHPLSLIMLDLDLFKKINDKFGHDAGDDVLVGTVALIRKNIRSTDHVIRWGGEEFLILAPGTTLEGAAVLAEKIRSSIAVEKFGKAGQITVSFGVAERFYAEPRDIWFKRADIALYKAKDAGRNRVVCWDSADKLPVTGKGIQWQPKWGSGNPIIDTDHRKLIEVADQLIESDAADPSRTVSVSEALEILTLIKHHFEQEEKILVQLGYPEANSHAIIHQELLLHAEEILGTVPSKETDLKTLVSFLIGKMILGHMIIEDSKFFPYTWNKRNEKALQKR